MMKFCFEKPEARGPSFGERGNRGRRIVDSDANADGVQRPKRAAGSLISILAVVFLVACDGLVRIRGRVVDERGAPIPEAQIQLERGQPQDLFTADVSDGGCFRFGRVVAPGRYKYNIHVLAPGFAPAHGIVNTIDNNYAVIVLRQPGGSQPSSITLSIDAWPEATPVKACDGR